MMRNCTAHVAENVVQNAVGFGRLYAAARKEIMIDGKLSLEIALRAGQVAKSALDFTGTTHTALLLRLRFKQLVDDINGLRETVQKAAAAEADESQPHIVQQAKV